MTLTDDDQPTASFTALTTLVDHELTFDVTVSDGATILTDAVTVHVEKAIDVDPIDASVLLDATTWNGNESYVRSTPDGLQMGDDFISVDTSQSYHLTGVARSGNADGSNFNPNNRQYFGFVGYDIDEKMIRPYHVNRVASAVDTTLAEPLSPNDTQVVVADATG